MPIKNIIFDLGGVIIDIDYKKTSEAFKALGVLDFDLYYTQAKQDKNFDSFETGKITAAEFRSILKSTLDLAATDAEIDKAWNAMLLDLPKERLEFIKKLRTDYKVYLFSNTNEIHKEEVFNICQRQNGIASFDDYFEKEYYSYIFGCRKPNPEAFLALLKEHNMRPEETLFIDDSIQNVLGARQAGLHAVHLTNDKSILDTLTFIKEINKNLQEGEQLKATTPINIVDLAK